MKKFILLSAVFVFASNFYGLPAWYSEQIETSEKTIFRTTGGFVDTTYTACDSYSLGDNAKSLEEAKDKAVEKAFAKISEKIKSDENCTKKILHCFYDENPSSGGAYVQVSLTESKTLVQEPAVKKSPEDIIRDYCFNLDTIKTIGDQKATLVQTAIFNPAAKDKVNNILFQGNNKINIKTAKSVTFKYADHTPVTDGLITCPDSEFQINFKNCVKKRQTFVIIRTDMNSECDEFSLVYKDVEAKEKIQHNKDFRWKNLIFEFDEDLIDEYTPVFTLKTDGKTVSIGSIYIFQIL